MAPRSLPCVVIANVKPISVKITEAGIQLTVSLEEVGDCPVPAVSQGPCTRRVPVPVQVLRWRPPEQTHGGGLGHVSSDVTLDPGTAHPELILSADQKCVTRGDTRQDVPDTPERFDPCACVLGAEGFAGGRRYWEVEVGDKTRWALGVCRESVPRKGRVTYTPGLGYWGVWLWGRGYKALTSPPTPLPISVWPRRVRVFLDYEGGEVSFYNVTDRSHLFTFTDSFSGTLRPYFSPGVNAGGTNAAPLTLCPAPAQP